MDRVEPVLDESCTDSLWYFLTNYDHRGVGNLILSYICDPENEGNTLHFYSSSGGNAGLAAVVAARDLECACTVVVPLTTKQMMIDRLRAAGATEVIQHGASWYEADSYLRKNFIETQKQHSSDVANNDDTKNVYIPPFDHPRIWEGNSTIITELLDQLPAREDLGEEGGETSNNFPADVIICSIGGGGLFNGLIHGLREHFKKPLSEPNEVVKALNLLAVETKGADSLAYSLQRGFLDSLSAITSIATSLGALQVASQTFENARQPPEGVEVTSVVASDAEAARGVVMFADETRILLEPACGVSIDVAMSSRLREAVKDRKLGPESRVVVIVCGGSSITPETVAEYRLRLAQGWN